MLNLFFQKFGSTSKIGVLIDTPLIDTFCDFLSKNTAKSNTKAYVIDTLFL